MFIDNNSYNHLKDTGASGLSRLNSGKTASPISIKGKSKKCSSEAMQGSFTFDYSNNNGKFTIGKGTCSFETKWSKASNTSIHAYKDGNGIEAIALIKGPRKLDGDLSGEYDFSSRYRTPNIGDIIIWKNNYGKYAATMITSIKDDTRGADHDELTCDYIVYV